MNTCIRASIKNKNTFKTPIALTVNNPIQSCAKSVRGANLQTPKNLETLSSFQDLIHITFSSDILGFVDDMYLQTYYNSTANETVVNIMSQNRLGKNDLGVN